MKSPPLIENQQNNILQFFGNTDYSQCYHNAFATSCSAIAIWKNILVYWKFIRKNTRMRKFLCFGIQFRVNDFSIFRAILINSRKYAAIWYIFHISSLILINGKKSHRQQLNISRYLIQNNQIRKRVQYFTLWRSRKNFFFFCLHAFHSAAVFRLDDWIGGGIRAGEDFVCRSWKKVVPGKRECIFSEGCDGEKRPELGMVIAFLFTSIWNCWVYFLPIHPQLSLFYGDQPKMGLGTKVTKCYMKLYDDLCSQHRGKIPNRRKLIFSNIEGVSYFEFLIWIFNKISIILYYSRGDSFYLEAFPPFFCSGSSQREAAVVIKNSSQNMLFFRFHIEFKKFSNFLLFYWRTCSSWNLYG